MRIVYTGGSSSCSCSPATVRLRATASAQQRRRSEAVLMALVLGPAFIITTLINLRIC